MWWVILWFGLTWVACWLLTMFPMPGYWRDRRRMRYVVDAYGNHRLEPVPPDRGACRHGWRVPHVAMGDSGDVEECPGEPE